MNKMDINKFREAIDSDEGLKSKRKILISLCVISIGLNFSARIQIISAPLMVNG